MFAAIRRDPFRRAHIVPALIIRRRKAAQSPLVLISIRRVILQLHLKTNDISIANGILVSGDAPCPTHSCGCTNQVMATRSGLKQPGLDSTPSLLYRRNQFSVFAKDRKLEDVNGKNLRELHGRCF